MEKVKLVIAIVRDIDAGDVVEQLVAHRYRVTRVASTGGFLRRGNVTLLIGVEEQHVQAVIDVLKDTCSPPEPNQHRATIFVVDAPHFEQI
ncbi:MAG: cyclic-di-AMP receptor [Anaerolineae bacterium]